MWLHNVVDKLTGKNKDAWEKGKIVGTVVLMKKNVLDLNDYTASLLDGAHEILGQHITFQLVSSTVRDPASGKGKVGKEAYLEEWVTTMTSVVAGESRFKVAFEWDESQGIPGAVIVKNQHHSEFFLKTLTLEGVPGKGTVVFIGNSWVYPVADYPYDRIFFTNDTYLPNKFPAALQPYKDAEFQHLRGDDKPGPYKEHDRIYRYDFYNDLGNPAKPEEVRPVLGGPEHPYPRRGRTGRAPTREDPRSESRLFKLDLNIYVPRDERFGHLKFSDFVGYGLKVIAQAVLPTIRTFVDASPNEFNSFDDIFKLYEGGLTVPNTPELEEARKKFPFEFLKDLLPSGGDHLLKLPIPQVIGEEKFAWRTDEEFGRETLAGVNPVYIKLLKEFPPTSTLDRAKYGDQTSRITASQIEKNMEGVSVSQALKDKRLFILDHHDNFMPYLEKINKLPGNYIYATRTLLFLKSDGTLTPVAIELSMLGQESEVYTPANSGVEGSIWQLAKAYAAVNDSAWHQLISHWLNTHAVIEPFVIATNRQLSVTHPVYKLLSPHYRDTMNINALARQLLVSAGGIFELTVFPGKYALTMSSDVYKSWKLTDHALPVDLVNRGMAVEDESSPLKVRLVIKDYPFAADGLLIWWAIEQWVVEYVDAYYPDDSAVRSDVELQAWWKEVREEGHGDKKNETWWPKMDTKKDLSNICAIVIWVASALHAAVNFGQYPYAGFLPNRPTVSRRPMPEPGTEAYEELKANPDKVFIETITSQFQTILGISLIELLSKHSSDEVYLGQRDTPEWTTDARALDAFKRFSSRLVEIENRIVKKNGDPAFRNRTGPVKFPYTLLYPNTSDTTGKAAGLSAKGIPNSVSI